MTAVQYRMWTLPIPPDNPLMWNEEPVKPREIADIENAPQAPPPTEPAP